MTAKKSESGQLRCFHVSMLLKDAPKDSKPLQYTAYSKDPWKVLEDAMHLVGDANVKGSDFKLLEMLEEIAKDEYVIAFNDITRKMSAYIRDTDFDDLPLRTDAIYAHKEAEVVNPHKAWWEKELDEVLEKARNKNAVERASAASQSKTKKPHIRLVAEDRYLLPRSYAILEDKEVPSQNA